MLLTIIAFIVTIGVIVTLHELGHFLGARLTGMRVKRFSIGFPPKMVSRTIGNTEFSLSWIPLGGYVQIAGMVDETLDDEGITGAPDEFMSKSPLQKIFVLSAGVLMNYLTAFVIISALTAALGIGDVKDTTVGEVMDGMPAQAAGITPGDQIVSVNGQETRNWDQLVGAVGSAGDSIRLGVLHSDGSKTDLTVPTKETTDGSKRRVIGIVPEIVMRSANPVEVIQRGWNFCAGTTAGIVQFLVGLATGQNSISELSGPLGVAQLSGESARQGSGAFLFFIAYVSVSIGFLNILPLPVLDGGHILYVLIEAVIRRPIPTQIKLWIQQAGMALLLILVLFVSYHDIMRIFFH